jgi:lysophospholipid acyltransferase (LPLAT)-like uncharacterized protein
MQGFISWAVGTYLFAALRTTRWQLHGVANFSPFARGDVVIAAFWHERLALMPMLWLTARAMHPHEPASIHMLVSQHRDGKMIASILHRLGVHAVHGSSSGGGAAGIRQAISVLRGGSQIVITPDGPRGPRRIAAPGVARLAALSGAPVLPCAAQISRRRVLKSWDRMVIPLPFGKGVLVCEPAIRVARDDWETSLPEIMKAMTAATTRADRLCGLRI